MSACMFLKNGLIIKYGPSVTGMSSYFVGGFEASFSSIYKKSLEKLGHTSAETDC